MTYYTQYAGTEWKKTEAKTMSGAKRAAAANCIFQGQTLRVGVYDAHKEEIVTVAVRHCDPITQVSQKWQDL